MKLLLYGCNSTYKSLVVKRQDEVEEGLQASLLCRGIWLHLSK